MMTAKLPKTRKALARKTAEEAFPYGVPVSANPKVREEEVNALARQELGRPAEMHEADALIATMQPGLAKCKKAVEGCNAPVVLTPAEAVLLYRMIKETR